MILTRRRAGWRGGGVPSEGHSPAQGGLWKSVGLIERVKAQRGQRRADCGGLRCHIKAFRLHFIRSGKRFKGRTETWPRLYTKRCPRGGKIDGASAAGEQGWLTPTAL